MGGRGPGPLRLRCARSLLLERFRRFSSSPLISSEDEVEEPPLRSPPREFYPCLQFLTPPCLRFQQSLIDRLKAITKGEGKQPWRN
jgi:hypothetical protein